MDVSQRATDLIYDIANYADDELSSGSSIEEISKQKKLDIVFTEPLDKNGLNLNKEMSENPLYSDKIFLDVLWNNIENEISINEILIKMCTRHWRNVILLMKS